MLTTTLRELREKNACEPGMETLIASLGHDYGNDTPITMIQILNSNGLDHTHWALENTGGDIGEKILNLAACAYAERTLHLFEWNFPEDKSSRQAIETKRKWVAGEASDDELAAAWVAWAATRAAKADEKQAQKEILRKLLTEVTP